MLYLTKAHINMFTFWRSEEQQVVQWTIWGFPDTDLEQHWPETTSLLQSTLLLLLTNPKSYRQFVESLEASTANNNVCSSETNGTNEEMMSQSVTYSLSAWWGKKLSKYVLWHHVVYLVNDQDVLNKIIS